MNKIIGFVIMGALISSQAFGMEREEMTVNKHNIQYSREDGSHLVLTPDESINGMTFNKYYKERESYHVDPKTAIDTWNTFAVLNLWAKYPENFDFNAARKVLRLSGFMDDRFFANLPNFKTSNEIQDFLQKYMDSERMHYAIHRKDSKAITEIKEKYPNDKMIPFHLDLDSKKELLSLYTDMNVKTEEQVKNILSQIFNSEIGVNIDEVIENDDSTKLELILAMKLATSKEVLAKCVTPPKEECLQWFVENINALLIQNRVEDCISFVENLLEKTDNQKLRELEKKLLEFKEQKEKSARMKD